MSASPIPSRTQPPRGSITHPPQPKAAHSSAAPPHSALGPVQEGVARGRVLTRIPRSSHRPAMGRLVWRALSATSTIQTTRASPPVRSSGPRQGLLVGKGQVLRTHLVSQPLFLLLALSKELYPPLFRDLGLDLALHPRPLLHEPLLNPLTNRLGLYGSLESCVNLQTLHESMMERTGMHASACLPHLRRVMHGHTCSSSFCFVAESSFTWLDLEVRR